VAPNLMKNIRICLPQQSVQFYAETLPFIATANASSHGSGFANFACEDNFVVLHPDETENIVALETHVFPNSPENAVCFAGSRKKETDGLLESNVFRVTKRADAIACCNRI
jgi:hypothetical protein